MDVNLSKIEGFEWDGGNLEHIKIHKVGPRECEDMFFNKPLVLNKDDTHSHSENRFRVYGITNNRRWLFVIFTIRKNKIRVVTARDQSKKERRDFQIKGGEYL